MGAGERLSRRATARRAGSTLAARSPVRLISGSPAGDRQAAVGNRGTDRAGASGVQSGGAAAGIGHARGRLPTNDAHANAPQAGAGTAEPAERVSADGGGEVGAVAKR